MPETLSAENVEHVLELAEKLQNASAHRCTSDTALDFTCMQWKELTDRQRAFRVAIMRSLVANLAEAGFEIRRAGDR